MHGESKMKAQKIMTSNPHVCHPQDKICQALTIMKEYKCGVENVHDGAKGTHLVGILTDRDIALKMCDEEKSCKDFNVESCMSKPVYFCHPYDDIQTVEQMMKQHKVHRIAVTDQNGQLQGIISLSDLAREAQREKFGGSRELPERELAEIIEEIDAL